MVSEAPQLGIYCGPIRTVYLPASVGVYTYFPPATQTFLRFAPIVESHTPNNILRMAPPLTPTTQGQLNRNKIYTAFRETP